MQPGTKILNYILSHPMIPKEGKSKPSSSYISKQSFIENSSITCEGLIVQHYAVSRQFLLLYFLGRDWWEQATQDSFFTSQTWLDW